MKAVVITRPGGPEVLEVQDRPTPVPQGDQILVRVRACGLNRADLMQSRGYHPAPPGVVADIPGLEYAGEVEALGPNAVGPLKVGDRVFGIVGGGGQAEYVVTPEQLAVPIPSNFDFEQAAAIPEVFFTAHDALENQAQLRAGETVLIHAVGSGVGTAALQLAVANGCVVFGTSRTSEKLELAAPFGLSLGIDTSRNDFAAIVAEQTKGVGVNVLLDLLGAKALDDNIKALAHKGRLVLVGLLCGGTATIDMSLLLKKRLKIVGTSLRGRPLEEKIAVTRAFADRVLPLLERGKVGPVIDRIYAMSEVKKAEERLEANLGFGKIILRV